ncbi:MULTISPECIES: hypothetical protein [Microbacterium]|nr:MULTISPECIES: hypothetical protein [Microbacterium]CAH0192569.1 hypothetical protein SRABI98_01796 [Microbacterium sp. Bi98]
MQSVLVGRDDNGVHITWALGDPAPASGVEYFMYSVTVYGGRASSLKQFGVKFIGTEDPEVRAFVFDHMGGGQSNYPLDKVTITRESISVHFVDASVGPDGIDSAHAGLNVNGVDLQQRFTVTLVD